VSIYGLEVLERSECERLLETQRVGRVGLCGDEPAILPVVYAMHNGDVVFRTAPGAKLIAALLDQVVVFEVDDYDVERHAGWSVNVVGSATEIVHPAELAKADTLGLQPWAGSARDRFVRVVADRVSGRRIVQPA
jgi:nitroimidazol reductase NimA-like FMN-containing flavoprotein (pyridoxamine 5'-phosphate oxidase superfamily)